MNEETKFSVKRGHRTEQEWYELEVEWCNVERDYMNREAEYKDLLKKRLTAIRILMGLIAIIAIFLIAYLIINNSNYRIKNQKITTAITKIEQMKSVKDVKIIIENNIANVYVKRFVTAGSIDENYIKNVVYNENIKDVYSVDVISK